MSEKHPPIWLSNEEASAWSSGYAAGYKDALLDCAQYFMLVDEDLGKMLQNMAAIAEKEM